MHSLMVNWNLVQAVIKYCNLDPTDCFIWDGGPLWANILENKSETEKHKIVFDKKRISTHKGHKWISTISFYSYAPTSIIANTDKAKRAKCSGMSLEEFMVLDDTNWKLEWSEECSNLLPKLRVKKV